MRNGLAYKRLQWRFRRLVIRASNTVGSKARLVRLSKLVTTVIAGSSLLLLTAQGCSTTPRPPEPLSHQLRASLGTVGVISVRSQIGGDVTGPVGTGSEAGRGAARGLAIGGLGGAGIGALAGLSTGPCAPVAVPILAGLGALGGFAIGAGTGAVIGAVNAIPTETAERLEAALMNGITARDVGADLRQRVLGGASLTGTAPVDLGASTADPAMATDYTMLAASGVHSVLEITITELAFTGEGGRNPMFALSLKARTRLIRVADNQVLWSNDETAYRSSEAEVSAWTAPESDRLATEISTAVETLAQQISKDVFVGTAV